MSGPTVSVCVPTFNREKFLHQTITSILQQTYRDFEVVICDNASTDATAEVVKAFSDSRIHYIRNPQNIGMAKNWVKSVHAANGRYFMILSDDDWLDPTCLERLVGPFGNHPEVDAVFCDLWIIDFDGKIMRTLTEELSRARRGRLRAGLHQPFYELTLPNPALCASATLIHRSRALELGALSSFMGFAVDFYLFTKLALAGGSAFYVPDRLAYYRSHKETVSGTCQLKVWQDLQQACSALLRDQPPGGRPAKLVKSLWADACTNEGQALLAQGGSRRDVAMAFGSALWKAPLRWRPWVGLFALLSPFHHPI